MSGANSTVDGSHSMIAILLAAAIGKSVSTTEQTWPPHFQTYAEFEAERKSAVKAYPDFGEWLTNQQDPVSAEREMTRSAGQALYRPDIWGAPLSSLKEKYVQETQDKLLKIHALHFVQCEDVKNIEGGPELSDAEIQAKLDRIRELHIIAGPNWMAKKSSALTALEEDVRIAQMRRRCALGLQPWEDAVPRFKTKPYERPP